MRLLSIYRLKGKPMPEKTVDIFEYERALRFLTRFIDQEQFNALRLWRFNEQAYMAAFNNFCSLKSYEYTQCSKVCAKTLLGSERTIISTLAAIFMAIPNPSEAKGMWDAGQELAIRKERERLFNQLNNLISNRYIQVRGELVEINSTLDNIDECKKIN